MCFRSINCYGGNSKVVYTSGGIPLKTNRQILENDDQNFRLVSNIVSNGKIES